MLSKEVFEEYAKKRLKELMEKGENLTIVVGFIDVFGDAEITECSKCGVPILIRPWLLKAAVKHNWTVVCLCCADPRDLKGQIAIDFAKIEQTIEKTW